MLSASFTSGWISTGTFRRKKRRCVAAGQQAAKIGALHRDPADRSIREHVHRLPFARHPLHHVAELLGGTQRRPI